MRRLKILLMAALPVCVLFLSTSLGYAQSTTTSRTRTFASDTTWRVFDADLASGGHVLGFAQKVCLNSSTPFPCPSGATIYGYPFFGWPADLSPIPGAVWIWAPGITGATTPADLNQFFFVKRFFLRGTPTAGTISVAADDFAEVRVNNVVVGTSGSITDRSLAGAAQSSLKSFDITPFLAQGTNTIAIRAQNGPASFAGCSTVCSYAQNPAGIAFGGSLSGTR